MRGGSTEPARIVGGELFRSVTVKTSTWKEYVFGCMSHPTHVILLSPQPK